MKNNLKNWVYQYGNVLRRKPSSWFLAAALTLIPLPSRPTPGELAKPFLRFSSIELPGSTSYPVNSGKKAPLLSAQGVYVVDLDSMIPLFTKNPDLKLYPASTTKIMTALVALDVFGNDKILTAKDADGAIGKAIHLKSGEQVTFENILYGLLLESGNDAAYTLAENYPGGYSAMIEAMNSKAKQFGMNNTTFKNVSGVDEADHTTTVHDFSILAAQAMENNEFAQVVGTREKEIESLDKRTVHKLTNTNELLGTISGVLGIKTGTTDLAGESLITYVERSGHRIIIVMLGSQDRYGEMKRLIEWAFGEHEWKNIISSPPTSGQPH